MKRYVVGFLFDTNGEEVVLIRKVKPEWQAGKYNGLGGHIDEGETPEQAMRREFLEEGGYDFDRWELVCTLLGGHHGDFILYVFRGVTDEIHKVEEGIMEEGSVERRALHEFTFTEASDLLPNLNWLIPMCLHLKNDAGMPFTILEVHPPAGYECRCQP